VPNKINGVEAKPARIAPASAVSWRGGNANQAAGAPAASDADVHLTGAARSLAAIEQSVRAMPAIDDARVAAVKEKLQSGSYQVDPQRIADKLLRMEDDLQRVQPLEKNPLR
jgi:negative regulator of flagellin synthesis FlgM